LPYVAEDAVAVTECLRGFIGCITREVYVLTLRICVRVVRSENIDNAIDLLECLDAAGHKRRKRVVGKARV
jgi:hypothetical protein